MRATACPSRTRRILYSMHEQGHLPDRKYVKSARVVGDVMGKYHPHGNSAIYALVRMAQEFSMRLPLMGEEHNSARSTAMRRRPCDTPSAGWRGRRCRCSMTSIRHTANFVSNYDGNEKEPKVLPARFPNLLVNGAGGIAVGMAHQHPAAQSG